ncbi:crosslink repair DNA glycosylase YcaQ family protein [Branchiibius sp. NY16-3462-2]|uniref:winged helix-turn-helix domain-containing protein n=1 Tax=Branchiibius sp. NY16-3462-2 TaxID=1807500 RepID=UPI000792D422|nr:crosslink repair DNA glycosylase YcaQ family protein [Branchiibius sp. NY16-3462-2]KYH43628.1 cytoplasmic protein [Branchiibius sp. NY16-3462-2]
MSDEISLSQARRIALAAQGFLDPPHAAPTMRTLERTVARTGVLQIDSVNVLARAHLMPLFSRMGPYDTALLHRATSTRPRRLVEYWAHCAAYMPVDLWPYMQHRMARYRAKGSRVEREQPALLEQVLDRIRREGAATPRQLDDGSERSKENWGWNWSATQEALDYLWIVGELAVAERNAQFERIFDLPQRVIPPAVLDQPTPSDEEAHRELIRRAARSLGVATELTLQDYYRMHHTQTKPAIATLVESGELREVRVQGWKQPAYLDPQARIPRRMSAQALLSPFDPVVWYRPRSEALFDFHYRIEIYTPAAKRVHGYYVLPFLLGDRVVARVDLKADRRGGRLLVHAAYAESHAPAHTAEAMAQELRRLAGWLGLEDIAVTLRGDLAAALHSSISGQGAVAGNLG